MPCTKTQHWRFRRRFPQPKIKIHPNHPSREKNPPLEKASSVHPALRGWWTNWSTQAAVSVVSTKKRGSQQSVWEFAGFPTGNRGFSHCRGYVVLEGTPWKIIMEHNHGGFSKIIFLSKWVICRFHVNLPGCMGIRGLGQLLLCTVYFFSSRGRRHVSRCSLRNAFFWRVEVGISTYIVQLNKMQMSCNKSLPKDSCYWPLRWQCKALQFQSTLENANSEKHHHNNNNNNNNNNDNNDPRPTTHNPQPQQPTTHNHNHQNTNQSNQSNQPNQSNNKKQSIKQKTTSLPTITAKKRRAAS